MMDCKRFQTELPDLILTMDARPSTAAAAHMKTCPPCTSDYLSLQNTFALLDTWKAPEPTPYFDQKLAVLLREEQAAPRMSFFERLQTRLLLNTGRNFRPALASALALVLIVGGGGLASLTSSSLHSPQASATVKDLQIFDRNEQAFRQLDELQQEDENGPQQDSNPASAPES